MAKLAAGDPGGHRIEDKFGGFKSGLSISREADLASIIGGAVQI